MMLAAALLGGAAHAAAIEPYTCRNGFFASEQDELRLAKVVGAKDEKLVFHQDDKGCPEGGAKCRSKAYVVAGDALIVNKVHGEWACAWYDGKKQASVGWVKVSRLQLQTNDATPGLKQWTGKWRFYTDVGVIEIAQADGKLHVSGDALWHGGRTADGLPVVHTGSVEGTMTPQGSKARLVMDDAPYSCQVDFTLLGKYLVVRDNGNCGGVNVRFDGVYTQQR